jgi:hypothetical protein
VIKLFFGTNLWLNFTYLLTINNMYTNITITRICTDDADSVSQNFKYSKLLRSRFSRPKAPVRLKKSIDILPKFFGSNTILMVLPLGVLVWLLVEGSSMTLHAEIMCVMIVVEIAYFRRWHQLWLETDSLMVTLAFRNLIWSGSFGGFQIVG